MQQYNDLFLETDHPQGAFDTQIIQPNSHSDQLPHTSMVTSSGKLGSISVEEELAKVGIFFSFHKVLGTGRFSSVYDGKIHA
jgi:hypothetical protein